MAGEWRRKGSSISNERARIDKETSPTSPIIFYLTEEEDA